MDPNKKKSISSKLSVLCRTCLMAENELDLYQIADIFLEEDEITSQIQSFEEVLCLFIDDEVGNQKDRLPKSICMACIEKARSAFQFIEMCRQTDALLQELLRGPKNEQKPEETVVAELDVKVPLETHTVFTEEIEMQSTDAEEPSEIETKKEVQTGDDNGESTEEESKPAVAKQTKRHVCDVCYKTFTQPQTLNRHKKIHSKDSEPGKSCNYCSRMFLRADDLRRHIRTHTNERPYVCELCARAYKQSFELKEHKASAHPESGVRKVHTCSICNKQLTTRNGLYVHMKAHRGEKNHVCAFCDKRFVTSGELSSHMKHVHTNEINAEQLPCGVEGCTKKFVTKAALRHHRITKHAISDERGTK
ncbi:transcription factor Ouib-like [Ochlerotatus camptorhynchus]|uniref:transcription factor Ouib-like n=1 Tax=Ochlerotatus camptorhynchus TaxID=644619 RepID=UPI0031E2126B